MPKTLTPKELAVEFDSDPRTVRKFLRACARAAEVETPGKGSRWSIEARDVRKLRKGFESWIAARTPQADEAPGTPDEG